MDRHLLYLRAGQLLVFAPLDPVSMPHGMAPFHANRWCVHTLVAVLRLPPLSITESNSGQSRGGISCCDTAKRAR